MTAKSEAKPVSGDDFWEILKIVLQALAIAFVVRVLFFQPFTIPSGSMEGTLLVGDYVFVSKYSYGYSKYSFGIPTIISNEILPVNFAGRIWPGEPKRGDVIVFRKPAEPNIDYIKRLVGLPGDKIQMQEGVLYLNGTAVPKVRIGDHVEYDFAGNAHDVPQFEETFPEGVKYHVLDRRPNGDLDNTSQFVVPAGHYFMMGDNRDNSSDSRDPSGGVGYVPFENLIGKAQIVFFSCNAHCVWYEPWTWPGGVRWSRLFSLVH